eukprot:tig00000144_g9052.t1
MAHAYVGAALLGGGFGSTLAPPSAAASLCRPRAVIRPRGTGRSFLGDTVLRTFDAAARPTRRSFLVFASGSGSGSGNGDEVKRSADSPVPVGDAALGDMVTQRRALESPQSAESSTASAAPATPTTESALADNMTTPATASGDTKPALAAGREEGTSNPTEAPSEPSSSHEPSTGTETTTPAPPSPAFASATLPASTPATDVMSPTDLEAIKSIFSFDSFFVTESLPYRNGAIFKGNMRKKDPAEVFATLNKRLAEKTLSEPYNLFMLENYEDGRPVVVASPVRNDPPVTSTTQKWLAGVLALASAFTCAEVGAAVIGSDIFSSDQWINGWPVAAGVFNLQVLSYLSRAVVARKYGVNLSVPFLVPSEQLGTFGAFVNLDSNPPTRKAILDIALVGSLVSFGISLAALLLGFLVGPPASGAPEVASEFFYGSALIGGIARLFLGDLPAGSQVPIAPLVAIGWAGLTVSALNLLPAGRLDGGRLVQSIFGRKVAARISGATLFAMGGISLFTSNAVILYFSILLFFLQRDPERPALDEISEPDQQRINLALFAIFLALMVLSPLPQPTPQDASLFASLTNSFL